MSNKQNNQEVINTYFCGKHKFQDGSAYAYHLHIINDHDTEHGIWQQAGTFNWTKGENNEPYYGRFRFLPIYFELECARKNHPLTSRRFGK